jgi:mannose-6-phosphate isomerase-like protein (cupin superfamily)
MEKISIEDVEPGAFGRDIDRRGLSEPLDTGNVAVNRYRLEPDERFSGGLHAHMDQEEVFIVIEGEATFETMDGEVSVAAGEAIRFAPGEFQSGKNAGEEPVVAFALGAPRDTQDVRIPQPCPECGHENVRALPADDGFDLVCPECEAEIDGA